MRSRSWNVSRYLALIFLICLFLFPRSAYPGPSWLKSAPREDGKFKYYVGRASHAPDEATGFKEATRDAFEQAIRENFGFYTQVNSQTYTTESDFAVTKRIHDLSRQVHIEGFEQADSFTEEVSGRFNIWILFQYQKTAIEKEKLRLRSQKDNTDPVVFSESGNPLDAHLGTLEVVTTPPGASVFVDGVLINFMETPLRLYGKIPQGKHSLRLDHPQFESVDENFIMSLGSRISVRKTLKPALASITVTSDPSGAKILINGEQVGKTPTQEIEIPAGRPVKIELIHSETDRYIHEVQVPKHEVKAIHANLPLKPATLSVSSIPLGGTVQLNGKNVQKATPTGKIQMEPGNYTIVISKEGYLPHRTEIQLRGGEDKLLPTAHLKKAASIRIESDPRGANITLQAGDTTTNGETPFFEQSIAPGRYLLSVSKDGYETHTRSVSLSEGQSSVISDITLERTESPSPPRIDSVLIFATNFIGLSSTISGLDQHAYGFGISAQLRPIHYFGIEAEVIYRRNDGVSYKNGKVGHVGTIIRLGLPIYPVRDSGFFISPEWLSASTTLKTESTVSGSWNTQTAEAKISQTAWGVSFGWLWMEKTERKTKWGMNFRVGLHQYEKTNTGMDGALSVSGAMGIDMGF